MSKVMLLLGGSGFLGSYLQDALRTYGWHLHVQSRRSPAHVVASPTDRKALGDIIQKVRPSVIVNLNAMTDVDACEKNPSSAFLANVGTVLALAPILRGSKTHLIHLSTDQLYSGTGPHVEDSVGPINVYGLTKFASELVAAELSATILRTNFVGRSRQPGRNALTDWIVKACSDREHITLFEDVIFSPVHLSFLSEVIHMSGMHRIAGTFNVSSECGVSKADFGMALIGILGLSSERVSRGLVASQGRAAARPSDMSMHPGLFEATFGIPAPSIGETIRKTASDYQESPS